MKSLVAEIVGAMTKKLYEKVACSIIEDDVINAISMQIPDVVRHEIASVMQQMDDSSYLL